MTTIPPQIISPSEKLVGKTLHDKYRIDRLVQSTASQSRRAQTVCYEGFDLVNSKKIFLKAFDFRHFDLNFDPEWLEDMLREFNNESNIAKLCKKSKLNRIVTIIDDFKIAINGTAVHCLVFDHDGTEATNTNCIIQKIRILRGIVAGMSQLHRKKIAHHDAAFRNALQNESGKIILCDLGTASCKDMAAPPHDREGVLGTHIVAPPEAFYGYKHPEWRVMHLAYDCYTIGALLFSVFQTEVQRNFLSGQGASLFFWSLLSMDENKKPDNWHGDYVDLIPIIRESLVAALDEMIHGPTEKIEKMVKNAIRTLCDPDPEKRGQGFSDLRGGHRYSLERYISLLKYLETLMIHHQNREKNIR